MSVEIIAEVATNHGGSLALAKEFIDAFAPYVDTVKFQLTRVKHLRPQDPQFEWFKRAEFTLDQFAELKAECGRKQVRFLVTVYNAADVWEVKELGCRRVKVGSGEAGLRSLQEAIAVAGLDAIVGAGLAPTPHGLSGWRLGALLLGCIPRYPAPDGLAAQRMMTGLYHGWSDHAVGLNELKAAICCGASVVETHVKLLEQARPIRPYEKGTSLMQELRAFADEDPTRFLGRWQA